MENFFVDEYFFSTIDDYLAHQEIDFGDAKEWVESLNDDWYEDVELATEEKIFTPSENEIVECIEEYLRNWNEDRYPEDSERIDKKVREAIEKSFSINKLNDSLPTMYYPNGKRERITKKDLLENV